MKKGILWTVVVVALISTISSMLCAQDKLAQSGFQFLSIGSTGRASAMGEAFTTNGGVSTSLFYNPAGLASLNNLVDISASWNSWIADINHNAVSLAVSPQKGLYGVFGLSFLWVDYGEFLGTMVWNNAQGYVDTENFSPNAMALGLGYGKSLTDKFSIGGQIKYVAQSSGRTVVPDVTSSTGLSVNKSVLSVIGFDFGTIYQTGYKSLAFGMSVRNFSEEIKIEQEAFQLPLTFRIGISMDVIDLVEDLSETHSLLVAIDAVHPRSHSEYICLGLEYTLMNLFSIRTGYISSQDEYNFTYGLGIQKFGLAFDYGYMPFGVFNNVQRVTIRYSL